jgi:hypothetical protein
MKDILDFLFLHSLLLWLFMMSLSKTIEARLIILGARLIRLDWSGRSNC